MAQVYAEPSKVENANGVVMVDGPDGVSVTLTPEAAVITGSRLIEQGAQAHGDKLILDEMAARREKDAEAGEHSSDPP